METDGVSGVVSGVVTALAVAAVKATRLRSVDRIALGALGARGDRAFYLIDERDRMVNGKTAGELQQVVAAFDPDSGELSLTFPDGSCTQGQVRCGETLATRFLSQTRSARLVSGPWAEALSQFTGRRLRLVAPETGIDRGRRGAASLISRASLARLAETAGADQIDPRRFRMLVEIDGVPAHAEDHWVGRRVCIGSALVAMRGHVGRCLVTSRDPDSGTIDLPTLDLLRSYRRELDSTEPLPFGVHGEVVQPGEVAVGDPVTLDR